MNTFDLSRNFTNWAFDNPEKVHPNHYAIYFFAIEHCNRLGGKEKFGFPSQMTMEAIGIRKHQTYIKYFNDLIEFGFFKLIEKSKNQYSANIISLIYAMPKKGKALDKANIKHRAKQTESTGQSTGQSSDNIDKQINKETINICFSDFWDLYNKKTDKKDCESKWEKLKYYERQTIIEVLPKYIKSTPDVRFRKNPKTWLNGKCWNDEIETIKEYTVKPSKPVEEMTEQERGEHLKLILKNS